MKTTKEQHSQWRSNWLSFTPVDLINLLDDIVELQDHANAQQRLAQNFAEAFEDKPDQKILEGMESYIETLYSSIATLEQKLSYSQRQSTAFAQDAHHEAVRCQKLEGKIKELLKQEKLWHQ